MDDMVGVLIQRILRVFQCMSWLSSPCECDLPKTTSSLTSEYPLNEHPLVAGAGLRDSFGSIRPKMIGRLLRSDKELLHFHFRVSTISNSMKNKGDFAS